MGFSTIFAVAIIGTLLLFVMGSAIMGLININYELSIENIEVLENERQRNNTSIEILEVEPTVVGNSCTLLDIKIANQGLTSIKVTDFSRIDVILKYYAWPDGKVKTTWVTYSKTGGSNTWKVDSIYLSNGGSEILNPLGPDKSSGQWDPDEILEITIELSAENAIKAVPDNPLTIIFVLPNGVKAMYTYIF